MLKPVLDVWLPVVAAMICRGSVLPCTVLATLLDVWLLLETAVICADDDCVPLVLVCCLRDLLAGSLARILCTTKSIGCCVMEPLLLSAVVSAPLKRRP